MDRNIIMNRLREHLLDVRANGYKPLYLSLAGSQNYNLDYEYSDIDTKAMVVPTLRDVVLNNKPVSTTHVMENNEHCDLKDIRLMFENFKKQNINFLEVLFSPYYWVDERYEEEFEQLRAHAEEIAHYNENVAVKCMLGMAKEKYKAMEHPYPTLIDKIEKYGYCYHKDTLFLTQNGWKKFDDIKLNEKIGTVNPLTKELEFQLPEKRIKHKCEEGYLYNFENNYTHFCVTEHHNIYSSYIKNINANGCLYDETKADWCKQEVEKVISGKFNRHVLSFPFNKNEEYDIDDEMLFLIGCFVSEGTINFRDKEKNIIKCLKITQSKDSPEFFNNMDIICKKYNGSKSVSKKETIWIINKDIAEKIYKWCGHGSENKHLPNFIYKLSIRQANILLKALILGDGTNKIKKENRSIYYTCSPELANDMVSLGFLSNKISNKNGPYSSSNKYGEKLIYQITIREKENQPSWIHTKLDGCQHHVSKISYFDDVVCFTVPNGLLVTMYNGKTAVQSNCGKQLHHIVRMREFMERYIDGEPFGSCLISNHREHLLRLKKNEFPLKEARIMAEIELGKMEKEVDKFLLRGKVQNQKTNDFLADWLVKLFTKIYCDK